MTWGEWLSIVGGSLIITGLVTGWIFFAVAVIGGIAGGFLSLAVPIIGLAVVGGMAVTR